MGIEIDQFRSKPKGSRPWVLKLSPEPEKEMKAAINISQPRASVDDVVRSGNRAEADFVKGMTHELHTPLNVIIGLCQVLERDPSTSLSPRQRDALGRMERNAQALLQTVDHLLGCLRSGHFEGVPNPQFNPPK
jgi:signal transduction histidine kinase